MPTYDYRCKNCEAKTQVFQQITDHALIFCEYCGKNTLEKTACSTFLKPVHDGSFLCCPCCNVRTPPKK